MIPNLLSSTKHLQPQALVSKLQIQLFLSLVRHLWCHTKELWRDDEVAVVCKTRRQLANTVTILKFFGWAIHKTIIGERSTNCSSVVLLRLRNRIFHCHFKWYDLHPSSLFLALAIWQRYFVLPVNKRSLLTCGSNLFRTLFS